MTLSPLSASLAARLSKRASATALRCRLPATALPPRSAATAAVPSWPATALPLSAVAAYHSWSVTATLAAVCGTTLRAGGTTVHARRSAREVRTAPAAAQWFSASSVGGDGDGAGVGARVPSAAQIHAALDEVNERFGEARLLLGEARDALGSVYFEEDFKDAQDAVAHTTEAWNNLLASVASQPETVAELRRSTGQKMKQLEEELRVMTDALIHDD
ncbi:hypothetical protein MMPV_003144 [Pyropia vietnamensis]